MLNLPMQKLPNKYVAERRWATMDFTAQLAQIGAATNSPPPTISSFDVTIEVLEGQDDNAADVLSGTPVQSGNIIGQWLIGGVPSVKYAIIWEVVCSDTTELERKRSLTVVE